MISLNIWGFSVTEWDNLKCAVAVNINNIECIIVVDSAYYHEMIKSVNENDSRVVAAELLFRLSLRTEFSHDVAFIQYYNYSLRFSL